VPSLRFSHRASTRGSWRKREEIAASPIDLELHRLLTWYVSPEGTSMGSVIRSWARIERWLESNARHVLDDLNDGASPEEIARLEELIGAELPVDVKESYSIHDGQGGEAPLIYGVPLLSLEQIATEWSLWAGVSADAPEGLQYSSLYLSLDGVREQYSSRGWIPFTRDYGGNHIAVDLDPWLGGSRGQVINYGRDENLKVVFAPSFEAFLERLADSMDAGDVVGGEAGIELRSQLHYVTHFAGRERLDRAGRWQSLTRRQIPTLRESGNVDAFAEAARQALAEAEALFAEGHPHLLATRELARNRL
jgi:cell wall assembly regulator SMI1